MLKKFWMGIVTILCAIAITITINYAWFVSGYDVDPLATGSSVDAYYLKGTGTEQDPYIITTPRHLYNLAWLQYLGTYNKPTTQGGTTYTSTYFKLGTTANRTLDMTGWPLPPIGTAKYPFIGNFNGNGWTISNLTTTNNFTEFGDKHPSGITANGANGTDAFEQANCGTIGFFGAIGAYNNFVISDTVTTSTEGVSYPTTTNTATNFYLNNTNVHTVTQSTIIGAVAGYVNATLSQIGVIQPHLNIATTSESAKLGSNFSDFAVVGYAESQYTTQKTKYSTIIYNPTYEYSHFNFKGMGSQADWGGSMNFADVYKRFRLNNDPKSQGINFDYVYEELIQKDGTVLPHTQSSSAYDTTLNMQSGYYTTTNYFKASRYKTANAEDGAYLSWYRYTTSEVEDFNYVISLNKDVYTVTKNGNAKTGYKIHDGNNHYLSYDAENDEFETVTSSDAATIWIFENNKIYTYDEEEFSTNIIRYLNGTTDLETTLSSTPTTTWSWSDTYSTFTYNYNGKDYYLNCINGVFKMAFNSVITNGAGHYIKRNVNTIEDTTNVDEATVWYFSENANNPHGILTDITDSTKKLVINGSRLSVNNTGTSWSYDGTNIFNGTNVIRFDGTNWVVDTISTYVIQYGNHYLRYSGGLTDTSTKTDSGTQWEFTGTLNTVGGSGTIKLSGQTRYLNYTTSGTRLTTAKNNPTTWNRDQYGIYYNGSNNIRYYIQYDSGWKAATTSSTRYTVYYSSYYYGTRYLSVVYNDSNNEYEVSLAKNNSAQTYWYFTDLSNLNKPSGYMYTIFDGVKYYLNLSDDTSSNSTVSSTTPHTFSWPSNNKLYDNDKGKYLYWSDYWSGNTTGDDISLDQNTYDNTANTPFAQIGAYTNYISRCDTASNDMSKTEVLNSVFELTCTKTIKTSEFSYIPLNCKYSGNTITQTVDSSNTGYIVGGTYASTSPKGDYRVSRYDIDNISSSYSSSNWTNNGILTVGTNGYGTAKKIGSSTYPESLFTKYSSSKGQLLETLNKNTDGVYGLHFMSASIDVNHLVVAPKVLINGKEYENYELPEDCIDFQLASRGYINFFAGTYFSGNNSFFSLHEVVRDSNNKITDIKHISKIYSANDTYGPGYKSIDNIYQYTDGTWSGTNVSSDSRYSLTFDKTWIESPEDLGSAGDLSNNTYKTYLWYFEIPVNKGEYALGSVDGGTGAYLIYLDIGANAAPVDRTRILQETSTTKEGLKYVNGIQILASGTYTSDADSAVAKVSTSINGDVDISRSTNTITFTASSSLPSTYKGEGITLSGATWSPTSSNTTVSKVLRYVDYNRSTDKLYYTTIYNNGTTNTGYDCYRIDNITTGAKTQITDTSVNAEWGILVINSGSGTPTSLNSFDNIATTQGYTYGTTKILDYYSYIETANLSSLTETKDMIVAADATVVPQADGNYVYEHSYHLSGNAIVISPNDLLVYIGPYLKNSVTITYANNVATVTDSVSNVSYTFTFNASAVDNTNKTITIFVSSS